MYYLLAVVAILVVLAIALGPYVTTIINEYERALKFVDGRYVALVGPGRHRYFARRTRLHRVDTRARFEAISGQEVLSSDGVAFKVSLLASYRITDPRASVLETDNLQEAVHSWLQLALRAVVAGRSSEELIQQREGLSIPLLEAAAGALAKLGVELQHVAVRDLTLPGDLKKVFSQVAQARQEGLAALERARGEVAALRSLANTAQLMERHPQLLQLRMLQVIGEGSGHTIVLGNSPLGLPHGVSPQPGVPPAAGEE